MSIMNSLHLIFLVVLLCSYCSLPAMGQTCEGEGPCRCKMSDGSGTVDFSSLGNTDGTAQFHDVIAYDGTTFDYNPCFAFSQKGCSDSAVCKREFDGTYSTFGTQASAVWSYNGFYPSITYRSTSNNRKAEVLLVCDESYVNPQLDVIGELTPGDLALTLWSKCACPGKCPRVDPPSSGDSDSLTAGSVMLIIFFSLLFVYIVGGMLFNYTRREARGKDMVPNVTFWSAIPGLIKDGFVFTYGCIRRTGPSRTDPNYEAI